MTDIVERLRDADRRGVSPPQDWTTRAADEIERLRALLPLLDGFTGPPPSPLQWAMICEKAREVRAALDAAKENR